MKKKILLLCIYLASLTAREFVLANSNVSMLSGTAEQNQSTSASTTVLHENIITIKGSVPSERIKNSITQKLNKLYPELKIINKLEVSSVVTPVNWGEKIEKSITSPLNKVSKGELRIDGNTVKIRGQISNDKDKIEVINFLNNTFGYEFKVLDNLVVSGTEQSLLDETLKNRIIEFDSGSSNIKDSGKKILDEMTEPILKLKEHKIQIIGHTDNQGSSAGNMKLSEARAQSIKLYLLSKNIPDATLETNGLGATQPLVSNSTEQGRKQNRRIEFTLIN